MLLPFDPCSFVHRTHVVNVDVDVKWCFFRLLIAALPFSSRRLVAEYFRQWDTLCQLYGLSRDYVQHALYSGQ